MDFHAKPFIVLGLPDEIYQHVDQHYTTHDFWQALASLRHEEEVQLIRREMTDNECYFHVDPLTNILSVSSSLDHSIPSHVDEHGTLTY